MIRLLAPTAFAALTLAACNAPETASAPSASASASAAEPVAAESSAASSAETLTAQGFGPLRIGMTTAEITAALGADANPQAVGGADPQACDQFRPARAPEGLMVMVEDGRLSRVSLLKGATIRTDRGFGIGDTAAAIKATYGDAARVTPHKYEAAPAEDIFVWTGGAPAQPYVQDPDARGVRYEIGSDGKVQAIHAGGPSIQLVEGCA